MQTILLLLLSLKNYLVQKRLTELIIKERSMFNKKKEIENIFMNQPEAIVVYKDN